MKAYGQLRILDLFCKAGGASVGYHQAFPDAEIVGVDIEPQPNYPYTFIQADAMETLADVLTLMEFDLVHGSPPCQRFSKMTKRWGTEGEHPDLVAATRDALVISGVPWVIENVEGAPLVNPTMLCGSMFGLGVRRHRLFETSHPLPPAPACRHREQGRVVGVYGHAGGRSKRDGLNFGGTDEWRRAMGIDWMTGSELAQAIPPAYTEWIGQLLRKEGVV